MAVFTGEDSPSFTEHSLDLGVFGQRLRHARRAKGLTLAELGERVGRAPSVLSLIENGRREPKLSLIEALAAALSVPTAELLPRQPPGPAEDRSRGGAAGPGLPRPRPAAPAGRRAGAERRDRAPAGAVRRAAQAAGQADGDAGGSP